MQHRERGEWAQVEALTGGFRAGRAAAHDRKAREARWDRYWRISDLDRVTRSAEEVHADDRPSHGTLLPVERHGERAAREEANAAERREAWHLARAKGQRLRFRSLDNCGELRLRVSCRSCSHEKKTVEVGCGIARLCVRCGVRAAVERRAKFGRARAKVLAHAKARGLRHRHRAGGRWSEKMLTLTVPHVRREDVAGALASARGGDVGVRVEALHVAWARFRKALRDWARAKGHVDLRLWRSFEWTPGADGVGHPHFHVWIWSPFLPRELLSLWWERAVEDAGVTIPESGLSIRIQEFRTFDGAAAAELIKGGTAGRRAALRWSKLSPRERLSPEGIRVQSAVAYAEGWSMADALHMCSPETTADLYVALEGRRLVQASAGLLAEEHKSECPCCGARGHAIRLEDGRTVHASIWHVTKAEVENASHHGETNADARGRAPPLPSVRGAPI